jgi:hypothetical protein
MPPKSDPFVMMSANPNAIPDVPRVVMRAGMRIFATKNPFSQPQRSPSETDTMNPRKIGPNPLPPRFTITIFATTPEKTRTLPTDRSIPAVVITNICPIAIIINTAESEKTVLALYAERKARARKLAKIAHISMRAQRR